MNMDRKDIVAFYTSTYHRHIYRTLKARRTDYASCMNKSRWICLVHEKNKCTRNTC